MEIFSHLISFFSGLLFGFMLFAVLQGGRDD